MKKMSEAEKLAGYEKALDKLTADDQFDKMQAVKAPETIRRFLSEDASDGLINRFAYRVNDVLDGNFNAFERGRIAYQKGSYEHARLFFTMAHEEGNKKAALYLARISIDAGLADVAGEWLKIAAKTSRDAESMAWVYYIKAQISNYRRKKQNEKKYLGQARDLNTDDSRYYGGMIKWQEGDLEGAMDDFSRGMEDQGSRWCADGFMHCSAQTGQTLEYGTLRKMLLLQIQRGDLLRYVNLGRAAETAGSHDEAAECFLKAVMIGVPGGQEVMLRFSMDHRYMGHALKACKKFFPKYPLRVFRPLVSILLHGRNFTGIFDVFDVMISKGEVALVTEAMGFISAAIPDVNLLKEFAFCLNSGRKYSRALVSLMHSYFGSGFVNAGEPLADDESESN